MSNGNGLACAVAAAPASGVSGSPLSFGSTNPWMAKTIRTNATTVRMYLARVPRILDDTCDGTVGLRSLSGRRQPKVRTSWGRRLLSVTLVDQNHSESVPVEVTARVASVPVSFPTCAVSSGMTWKLSGLAPPGRVPSTVGATAGLLFHVVVLLFHELDAGRTVKPAVEPAKGW